MTHYTPGDLVSSHSRSSSVSVNVIITYCESTDSEFDAPRCITFNGIGLYELWVSGAILAYTRTWNADEH